MGEDKTICLCAIVKNEAKTLPRLIKSCKAILDYWVIIDTGSTDNTKEVIDRELRGVTGELHDSPFVNFEHNRTELVKLAKGKADYLLLMDADMVVMLDRSFNKQSLEADIYQIRYTGAIDYAQPLLVSGKIDWYYIGYTHEYLTTNQQFNQGWIPSLKVTHHFDGGSRDEKFERDLRLCAKEIKDHPERPRPHFYLAQSLQNTAKYEEAILEYQERIKMGGWHEEIYYSLYQVGICLYMLKNFDSAILQFMEAYNMRPTRFEALFMIGQINRERKRYASAKLFFEKVYKMPYPKDDILFIHRTHKDFLVDFELGICNYWLGRYKDADKHARRLLNRTDIDPTIFKQNTDNYKFIKTKLELIRSKKNDLAYVSMYTHGTPYEQEVKTLEKSLKKFNLFYEIVGIRPQGSWVKNTQMKPEIIKTVMDKHNKDIVWVDADAEVLEKPAWFDTVDADIAFHTIQPRGEMLTGTVYFKNNDKVKDFLKRWEELNKVSDLPDAMTFQALLTGDTYLKIVDMPPAYVRIFDADHMKDIKPVIVHNQASRRFKEEMNTGIAPDNMIFKLFEDLKDGEQSCSVIGNGPYTDNLAAEIDESFVMRCNNFHIGEGYEELGDRIDLNISSLFHEILPVEKVDYPIFGVLPLSDTLYQKYTDAKQMHHHWKANSEVAVQLGCTVWTYNDNDDYAKLFAEIAAKIDAFPTVGLMGIATARKLGFNRIILSGFSFFQTDKSHYWSDIRVQPSSHHNAQAEKELVQHWIEHDDIEYVLDNTLKENLYQDEAVGYDTVK